MKSVADKISNSNEIVPMGNICHLITDGKHGDCQNDDTSGYFFISSKDVTNGRINYENARQITFEDFQDTHKRTQLEPLDIIITNSGTIGRMAIVMDNECTQRTTFQKSVAIIKPNRKLVNTYWLFYYLQMNKDRLISYAGGTAQKNLLLRDLRAFNIELCSLHRQQRIASILSAYDDLIENNTRRIKILEEMAKLIYREWFVEFKAPGVKLRKATTEEKKVTGKDVFPNGWEISIVNDLFDLKSGFAFKSGSFDETGIFGLVTIKNVQDGFFNPETTNRLSELPTNMPDYCLINTGDLLMSLTGNIGRVCITYGNDLVLNQRVSKIVPISTKDKAFSYCYFRQPETQKKLELIANGVAQQNLSPIDTGKIIIVKPNQKDRNEFHDIVQPMIDRIVLLYQMNTNLRQTRDLLLPKLVSGEVEVW